MRGRKRDLSKNVSELKRELKRKDKEHNYQIEELENKFNSKILEIQVEFENKFSERDAENELIADVMKMRESPELKDSPHIYNKSPVYIYIYIHNTIGNKRGFRSKGERI